MRPRPGCADQVPDHVLIFWSVKDHPQRAIASPVVSATMGSMSEERGAPDAGTSGTQRRLGSPDRVVALSDGVFAIIITILVLEIAVPEDLSDRSLVQALDDLRPTLVAWVASFLLTGMFWIAHRDLFARVRVVNRDLVWLDFCSCSR